MCSSQSGNTHTWVPTRFSTTKYIHRNTNCGLRHVIFFVEILVVVALCSIECARQKGVITFMALG